MKKLIFLIISMCLADFSFSQTDYRKGYVITNASDTLFGEVDYRERAKAYKSCDFRVSKGQSITTYEPNNIIGYGFENDKFFQSREISIKNQPSQIVFLEVIVRGLLSLYKLENIYFIGKGNDSLQQLINEAEEVFVEGRRVLKNTNQYIGTINMLVFDCAEIRTKVHEIRLREEDLTNLIEDYNRCQGEPSITFKENKPWTKARIGVTGGLNISQLNFNTNPGYEHLAGGFKVSKSPIIGISFEILSPRLNERISFHGDLLYMKSNYYKYSQFSINPLTKRNYVTIELQQVKIPISLCYTFPKRNFTPFFKLGISSSIHLSSNSKWIQEVEANNDVITYNNEALELKRNQLGLWGGFGLLKSINAKLNTFIEFRYEQSDGVSENSLKSQAELKSRILNFQILIGIRTK